MRLRLLNVLPKIYPSKSRLRKLKNLTLPRELSIEANCQPIVLRLSRCDFAQWQETIAKRQQSAQLIEDHRVHDPEAAEECAADADQVRHQDQRPAAIDVAL